MIDIVMALPPLHLVFDRTKWNGDNTEQGYKKRGGMVIVHNPPSPLGRHPFNIITEEIYDEA